MSSNFGYIDIILLAMIAGFIILRLRSILGRKTGHEDKIYRGFTEKKFEDFQKKQEVKFKKSNSDSLEGEEKVKFIEGAEIAYETIITSFAKGDKKTLKNLLTPQMTSNFDLAIADREKQGIKSELTFIGMKESSLEKYEKIQNNIYATVKFVSDIISVKKDNSDKVIEGNPDRIKTVIDQWRFTKKVSSSSPNWYLAEILSK
jgi:predicted lipid-binding transport protein (Tim44 family)|tara:strand:- start:2272 stop:2880 length:609 start_codon:yes stop_codon:yes gene_type:complete